MFYLLNLLCAGGGVVDGRDGRVELSGRALVDVSLVEESGKEYKVRKVHEQREFDVLLADVARFTVLLQLFWNKIKQNTRDYSPSSK
jgi:hypothetical protein